MSETGKDPYLTHFQGRATADYGKRPAIVVSLVLHLLALGALVWAGSTAPDRPPPNAIQVKLGGPPNMQVSGKKRKAPVAGVTKPKEKPTPKKKTEPKPKAKPKAKPKDNEIGLNRDKTPKKNTKPEPAPEKARDKEDEAPPPEPVIEEKSKMEPRAVGGLDGDKGIGVSVEVGDGSEDINTEDVSFRSYFITVQSQIASRWTKTGFSGGVTRIRFVIHRDGSVSDVTVAKSSGKSYLDGPALRAVMGSEFPPLPQGYKGDQLIVNLNFHYESR